MNNFSPLNFNFNIGTGYGTGSAGWPGSVPSFGSSVLGAPVTNPLQMMSSLMQSMFAGNSGSSFGSNQCSLPDLFNQFQQNGGNSSYPCYGGVGGQAEGGFGCRPHRRPPHRPRRHQGPHGSQCQNFQFGQNCPPSRCDRNNSQGGTLSQEAEGKPISYTTSGGYKVSIDGTTINVTDPNGKNTVKTWGDPHENVNGTHVKDWEGKQRSIVLEDGTKITMTADGPKGVVENTSIYDGNQSVQITNKGNQITGHTFDPRQTAYLDASQYDGETALFSTGYNGAATYANIYNQDSSFNVTRAYQAIATTGGYANPNQVNDLYKG